LVMHVSMVSLSDVGWPAVLGGQTLQERNIDARKTQVVRQGHAQAMRQTRMFLWMNALIR